MKFGLDRFHCTYRQKHTLPTPSWRFVWKTITLEVGIRILNLYWKNII
jgi:hypothetical protein